MMNGARRALRFLALAVAALVAVYWIFAWASSDSGPLNQLLSSLVEILNKSADRLRFWE